MFNWLKRAKYNFLAKSAYSKISNSPNEDIYVSKRNVIVIIHNKEIGKKIYGIVKDFKETGKTIFSKSHCLTIRNYTVDQDDCIDTIFLKSEVKCFWNFLKYDILILEFAKFLENMQKNGYVLDEETFNPEECNTLSGILSFFVPQGDVTQNINGCFLKYVHYIKTGGGNFQDFYNLAYHREWVYDTIGFSYGIPIIKLCLGYFNNGVVPDDFLQEVINEILSTDDFKEYVIYKLLEDVPYAYIYRLWQDELLKIGAIKQHYDHVMLNQDCSIASESITQETKEYTIFRGNIKIYKRFPTEFCNFLKEQHYNMDICLESVDAPVDLIVNLDEDVIGYYFKPNNCNAVPCMSLQFKTQKELVDWIRKLFVFIQESNHGVAKTSFNMEETLLYQNGEFFVPDMLALYHLYEYDIHILYNQIVNIFFKKLHELLQAKYGDITSKNKLMEVNEVRYLPPILATEFIKFVLKGELDFEELGEVLRVSLDHMYYNLNNSSRDFAYDNRLILGSVEESFIFTNEVFEKYGIRVEREDKEIILPTGERMVLFARSRDISKIREEEESLIEVIERRFRMSSSTVKILSIEKVIYSDDINSNGGYKVRGYILPRMAIDNPTLLTKEFLLSLSNRDMLKIYANLLSKFTPKGILEIGYRDYIAPSSIFASKNLEQFYIDIHSDEFAIIPLRGIPLCLGDFLKYYSESLIEMGYNPYAFLQVDFDRINNRGSILELINSLKYYCDKHKIYYRKESKALGKGLCPVCAKTLYLVPERLPQKSLIFQDKYASHYKLSKGILKIYNEQPDNLLEQSIDELVALSQIDKRKPELGQDCFIPHKKAIDQSGKFVGYFYEFEPEDEYLDLKSPKLSNLHKVKCLIRLITQVNELVAKGYTAIKNPFTHVFLCKNHKKQVQIPNVEFWGKYNKWYETEKWLCNYVTDVIKSDKTICVNSANESSLAIALLKGYAKKLVKYCSTHNTFYEERHLFCPYCLAETHIGDINSRCYTSSREEFKTLEVYNEGGESNLYKMDLETPKVTDCIAKVFKEDMVDMNLKNQILLKILKKGPILPDESLGKVKYSYVNPEYLLVDKKTNEIFGYTMKEVKGKPIASLRNKTVVEQLGFDRSDILEILINVGKGIECLHNKYNIYIGDLNGRNILFNENKEVYFVDLDGMGIDNIEPVFATMEYIDPNADRNHITMKDDWYSFAIQAFYYLTYTHPFNGIYYALNESDRLGALDIVEKMQRRISLLGDHGMKPPKIALPWDWMSEKFKKILLNTFEGDTRVSIVPYLEKEYEKFRDIRVNPMFTAKRIRLFSDQVVYWVNDYSAVCLNNGSYYLEFFINGKMNRVKLLQEIGLNVKKVQLWNNSICAIFIEPYELYTNSYYYTDEDHILCWFIPASESQVVDGHLYMRSSYQKEFANKYVITESDLSDVEDGKKEILLASKKYIKCFSVLNSTKIITVCELSASADVVYLNDTKFYEIQHEKNKNPQYNIIYDSISQKWLIISDTGKGIIISYKDGTCKELTNANWFEGIDILNVVFENHIIYIPNKSYLGIIDTKGDPSFKKLTCGDIMDVSSKVFKFTNEGFYIASDKELYELRRN